MKELFQEYYPLSEAELSAMWERGIFVMDANVLLNLYRYSPLTRDEFTAVLEAYADRLWLPYQAALEYQRNRSKVILEHVQAFEPAMDALVEAHSMLKLRTDRPLVCLDRVEAVEDLFDAIYEDVEIRKRHYEDLLDSDIARERIDRLFDGRVGPPYSEERLEEIFEQGERRYEQKRPPGYADAWTKTDNTKYGDLVIWFQMLDYSAQEGKPIIFVTEDLKEDWWQKVKGVRLGVRPELRREMNERASVPFCIYTMRLFLEIAADRLDRKVDDQVFTEIQDVEDRYEGAEPQQVSPQEMAAVAEEPAAEVPPDTTPEEESAEAA